ncbi:hypothetical protein D3C85_1782200 [compost metagenome]
MLFGRVGRAKAQRAGDFGAGRGRAGALDGRLDQIQDLLLSRCELGMIEHGGP